MTPSIKQAQQLAVLQAPLEIQATALLAQFSNTRSASDRAVNVVLGISRAASQHHQPLALLPEMETLLRLDQGLPEALRIPRIPGLEPPAAAADAPEATAATGKSTRLVRRTLEAMTPWLQSTEAFASAAKRADNRCSWGSAAPQITIRSCLPDLPASGALWRGRLSKRTDLIKPFDGSATEETIEITAEGRNGPQGQGLRRYSHFLVESLAGPGLLQLVEDSGLIELSGNARGSMLRIRKRVTVLLPEDFNNDFGPAIELGFSTLLWQWAMGFVNLGEAHDQASGHQNTPIQAPHLPSETKAIPPPTKQGAPVRVAVLGAGPAGLACAWLLSKPTWGSKPAWTPPAADPSLEVSVTLVDKACRPGGKAASGRRQVAQAFGIEEHGLHVLMGCYSNLLAMLQTLGATAALSNLFVTQVPRQGNTANGPADTLPVALQAWAQPASPAERLVDWMRLPGFLDNVDWTALGMPGLIMFDWLDEMRLWDTKRLDTSTQAVLNLAYAVPAPRPLLRTALRLWETVDALAAHGGGPGANGQVAHLAVRVGLKQLALAELVQGAERQFMGRHPAWEGGLRSRGNVAELARLLRLLARSALPANAASAEVRLVGELVELATTIAAALDDGGQFPDWAIPNPPRLADTGRYPAWASALQALDCHTLAQWLTDQGAPPGFANNSGVLAALTAGLFTTPEQIGAGTFIHGLVRLLLTYQDAPYKRLQGGTGEAVISPIYQALLDKGVAVQLGTEVRGVERDASGVVRTAKLRKIADCAIPGDFAPQLPGSTTPGWPAQPTCTALNPPQDDDLAAEVFVLAIPPFGGTITGLHPDLEQDLLRINHVATIGLQFWATQAPKFPAAIVAGLAGPLRCSAAMDHLQGGEGPAYTQPPVYWCGEVDDDVARRWQADPSEANNWLRQNAGQFVGGAPAHPPFLSVNLVGSARYVLSDVQTQAARRDVFHADAPNLWLAGDWTRSAFGCGSIEAAVTSGLEAARQILEKLGCDVQFPIVGALSPKEPA